MTDILNSWAYPLNPPNVINLYEEPETECTNCGAVTDGEYKNTDIRSKDDEHFCDADCERLYHEKYSVEDALREVFEGLRPEELK